jgi:hypothetical protein
MAIFCPKLNDAKIQNCAALWSSRNGIDTFGEWQAAMIGDLQEVASLSDNKDGGWWRPLPDPDVPRLLKALCVAAWAIGFCGLLGLGYCEHEQRFASSRIPTATLPIASDFKGENRFISQGDARIRDIST